MLSPGPPPPKTHTHVGYIETDTTLISLSQSLMERIQPSSFGEKRRECEVRAQNRKRRLLREWRHKDKNRKMSLFCMPGDHTARRRSNGKKEVAKVQTLHGKLKHVEMRKSLLVSFHPYLKLERERDTFFFFFWNWSAPTQSGINPREVSTLDNGLADWSHSRITCTEHMLHVDQTHASTHKS